MRRIKLFSLIQERVARSVSGGWPNRWSARRRASWSASGGSAAVESLESRCLLSAGDLDPSFGVGGKVVTPISNATFSGVEVLAIQGDGKIIAVGSVSDGQSAQFAVARYTTRGLLDTSFGINGSVTTAFDSDSVARCVAIQPNGRIVVAGQAGNQSSSVIAVARYNTDGTLDTTFGVAGKVTTSTAPTYSGANSIVLQSDGRIVVAGFSSSAGDNLLTLVRYNTNGSIDTTFGTAGTLVTDLRTAGGVNTIAIQDDQKFVVTGATGTPQNPDLAVERINADGTLDTTFGVAGRVSTDFGGGGNDIGRSVAVLPDGKILALSHQGSSLNVSRYTPNGAPDSSFGSGGKRVIFGFGRFDNSNIAIQSDGKVLITANSGDGRSFGLVRFDSDFTLDLTFGAPAGSVLTDFGFNDTSMQAITLQGDGKIVVGGYSAQNFALARYLQSAPNSTPSDDAPVITSSDLLDLTENTLPVVSVTATNPNHKFLLFGITGGADQSKFSINFQTGALSFIAPPDFEHPTDSNHDNVYIVQVTVSDGTHLVTQDISVTVSNVNETVTIPLPANGGNFKTLFLNGQLHLRSSLGKRLIAPVTLPSGADVQFNGSNAADRLTLDRSWSGFTGSLAFNGNGGNDQLDTRTVSLGVTFNGGDGNDTFLGGSGDDTTNGGMGLDSLSGNDGNDSLTGGDGNDKLYGGAGSDLLSGDAGTDSLSGGDDDDSLSGGDANDTLNGDVGNDTITGGAGADIINGGDDDDLLFGNAGNDAIDGGTGDDVIDGGDDNDNLKGTDGDDAIRGGNGNDTLSGGNGNDLLTGSAGNDSLKGDAGTDTLLGDAGNDVLEGGLDIDRINGVATGLSKDTISDSTKVIDTSFSYDFDALLAGLL